ncbi:hypothetical protein [Actinocorallia sp. A-T 12471]|uniref:hypothetical protein n=1 Tax=Actinocorallia sp. A-T 12471 TaxID=3089813 RepID=UPI0029CF7507|nr:hypothetical protein [Actinocorallia sp. A-T 12471]MDX6743112.1 hypothetical protein [Actinocorallia sp. A-T 12471]
MRNPLAVLLDIRTVIGGIFTIYGIILTILGIIDDAAAKAKAQGVDINLWVGLAMLVFGLCFLGWTIYRPRQGPSEKHGPDPLDEPGGPGLPGGLTRDPRELPGESGSTAHE